MKSAVLIAMLTCACRSAAPHYYTLVPPAVETKPVSATLAVEVEPVEVPADVDRAEIVVRRGAGEVTTADSRAWIAPLPLEIKRAIESDLGQTIEVREGAPYRVRVTVRRFESTLGVSAMIDAAWTIHAKDRNLTCSQRATEPARVADYETLVLAHQKALGSIAGAIATSVRAVANGATDEATACAPAAGSAAAATAAAMR
jgi:hypothetical protein